jgi:YD repeat-containing protein
VKYTWDAENRLTAIAPATDNWTLEFAYDFAGRRMERKASQYDGDTWVLLEDRKFVYDGWLVLLELDGLNADAVTRAYTWGLDVSGTRQWRDPVRRTARSSFIVRAPGDHSLPCRYTGRSGYGPAGDGRPGGGRRSLLPAPGRRAARRRRAWPALRGYYL